VIGARTPADLNQHSGGIGRWLLVKTETDTEVAEKLGVSQQLVSTVCNRTKGGIITHDRVKAREYYEDNPNVGEGQEGQREKERRRTAGQTQATLTGRFRPALSPAPHADGASPPVQPGPCIRARTGNLTRTSSGRVGYRLTRRRRPGSAPRSRPGSTANTGDRRRRSSRHSRSRPDARRRRRRRPPRGPRPRRRLR